MRNKTVYQKYGLGLILAMSLTTITPITHVAIGANEMSSTSVALEEKKDNNIKELNMKMYASSNVNVRSGPSTDYDKIGRLDKGEEVQVTGQSKKTGWYRINYNGKTGYVSKNYLQEKPLAKKESSIETLLNNAPLNPKRCDYEPLNEIVDQIFSEILNDSMTTYQKVKACYDYLIENCKYGDNYGSSMEDRAYSILTRFEGGCSSYSAAFTVFMQRIGLDCYRVEGDTSSASGGYVYHVWCEMVLDDTIYIFDPQVEDNIAKGGKVKYYRFAKTYEQVPEKYLNPQKMYEWTSGQINPSIQVQDNNFIYIIEKQKARIVSFIGYDISDVVIPREVQGYPVTAIADFAFAYCSDLENITIPYNVTSIGNSAFYGCDNFIITTPEGSYAETYAGIKGIPYQNIMQESEPEIEIVETDLEYRIENNEVKIAGFQSADLTEVVLPQTILGYPITSIDDFAFLNCINLNTVVISDNVTNIGSYAFAYCRSLTNITIPDSVTTIGDYAFTYCSDLTSIHIPSSVTSIGEWVFENCDNITIITPKGSYAETYAKMRDISYQNE